MEKDLKSSTRQLRAIDKLYTREEIMEEVERHNAVFDLEDFYLNNPGELMPSRTGYRIISSDSVYSGYCFPYSEKHEDVCENILFAMYDDYNSVFKECKYDYRDTAVALGAVFFQLVSKFYSLVWVSSQINEFQYNAILEFANEMREINRKLIENGENDIKIGVCLTKKDGSKISIFSLDEAVFYLSRGRRR